MVLREIQQHISKNDVKYYSINLRKDTPEGFPKMSKQATQRSYAVKNYHEAQRSGGSDPINVFDFKFLDPSLSFNNGIPQGTYYLGFYVKLAPNLTTSFTVKLQQTTKEVIYEKTIKNFKFSALSDSISVFAECLITIPLEENGKWDTIVFEKVRTSGIDYVLENREKLEVTKISNEQYQTVEGEWTIHIDQFPQLFNGSIQLNNPSFKGPGVNDFEGFVDGSWLYVLDDAQYPISFHKLIPNQIVTGLMADDYIEKIGIQGTPLTLFSFNGEEFRIGKTGLFEIEYKPLNLKDICVMKKNEEDFFIVDCKVVKQR